MNILALNSGSSSLKFGCYRVDSATTELLLSGGAESIGDQSAVFKAYDSEKNVVVEENALIPSQRDAIIRISKLIEALDIPATQAIGHRIVHGGPKLRQHCIVDDSMLEQLQAAIVFAPLHTPSAITVIRFATEHFPAIPQVTCFDTAFHSDMPELARVLPIPKNFKSEGIQRYGFHGLSCESIIQQLINNRLNRPPERVIIAHLGNGASITAVRNGKSIDTTMGLTPSGGVIMGTRSGDLDPGLLIYLMREKNLDASQLETLIDHCSGLLGISGVASDLRRLHESASSNPDSQLAIEMFCCTVRKQIAAMISVLDGVDMIVFTGGVGEYDAEVRAAICRNLSWIGVSLDDARNRNSTNPISSSISRSTVNVLPSREDDQIARHTFALLSPARLAGDHERFSNRS